MSQARDIIDGIRHRLPNDTGIYADLNKAVRMISKRLKYHDSSMIKGALSVTITADSSSGSMPSDFWGLLGKPYISGKTYTLEPVPDQETKMTYTTNSTPIYYELRGTTIYLYPGTSPEITIKGDYWSRPTVITKLSDTIPFSELFDDAIQEALVYVNTASTDPNSVGFLQNFINKSVDEIMPGLEQAIPYRFSDDFNLDTITNEGW